jgi:hypothetical protein
MTFSQELDRLSLHFVKISLQIANCREENPSRRAQAAVTADIIWHRTAERRREFRDQTGVSQGVTAGNHVRNGHDLRVMDFGLLNHQIVLQPIINKYGFPR